MERGALPFVSTSLNAGRVAAKRDGALCDPMIPYLIELLYPWLKDHGLGGFRVFFNAPFRSMLCIPLAFILCILFGPRFINWLVRQKIGDNPTFDEATLNDMMASKKNTPTTC